MTRNVGNKIPFRPSNLFDRRTFSTDGLGKNLRGFAPQIFSSLKFSPGRTRLADPPPPKIWRVLSKFLRFGENLGFRRKFRISAKISNFGENLGFRRKSRISAKISNFGENLGLPRKSRTWAKISNFGENLGLR